MIEALALRTLSRIRRVDAPEYGRKAACLGELSSRGYLVPSCVVLPTSVYQDFVLQNRLAGLVADRAEESRAASPARLVDIEREMSAAFAAAELHVPIQAQIHAWTSRRRADAFAVRSSATDEDRRCGSFAGQYRSFLNIDSTGVPHAVVRCFASLFGAAAALYRRRKNVSRVGAMAVIVQEMLRSDHAGVIFTQSPRRPGTLLVECAPGSAEDVVSGTVSPNRYYLNRTTLRVEDSCERHRLDFASVSAAARQALAIEADFGGAQDVEYGVVGNAVHIFQARPVNA
jgi:phosphoenolpyruvate synthase/pyruvate phosphate dikinase